MFEGSNTGDNTPTFVALPVDSFEVNILQKPEQFRIIKNAVIKKLSDDSLCIIDTDDASNNLSNQIQITYLPPVETTPIQNATLDKPPVTLNTQNEQKEKQSPIYKCPKCKEVFNKIASYRKHMMWHRNVKKFKCDKCSAGYNVETNLKIHRSMHAEGKPTCPVCSISFQRLASLKSHLMLHQVEEMYTCEECGAEFEKEEELNKHLFSHLNNTTKEKNLICTYCNVQFEDHKNYKEHISHHIKVKKMVLSGKKSRRTHGNKDYPHVCSVCSKSFSRLSLLERHLRVHSGERPFICEHCNRGFNQKGTLQIHLSKHTGIKPFECTLCSAKFNQKGNLRVHVEKTHTAPMPGEKMYKCSHCTCIFKKIASLNVHITKFHANNENEGSITNVMKQLKELEEVAGEKKVGEESRDVSNEGDGSSTSYVKLAESFLDGTVRRYLVMQKKVNDTRWYICNYCKKEFKKPSDLIRHTRVHTREKPFVCNKCGARFSLKSSLFCHIKTHSGNNNYYCPICMKKFPSIRSVNSHVRKHSDRPQYKCLLCNKWFSSVQKAKLHNKEAHGNRSEKDSSQVVLKQPLVSTPNGLLPVAPLERTTNTKQVQCPICCTRFSKMPNLKRHMLLHNGERKFKCDQCQKAYFTAHALKEHQLYHSGVRNFVCKVCAKRYMTASLLKRHLISHSTSKPYVCPYCNKNFKSVMLCRTHMNVHKKEVQDSVQEETGVNSEATKIISLPEVTHSNLLTQEIGNTTDNTQLLSQVVETPDSALYEMTPDAIQVITKELTQDTNQVQTIFINCEDLPLANSCTPNTDTVLFNTLNELQETNGFNIGSLNEGYIAETSQPFNVNQILTNEANTYTTNISNPKVKSEKTLVLNNINLSDNISYYPQSELNLLFNLDPEFESNNCDLPDINLNEVPDLNVEPTTEENKTKTKQFACEKCNKVFTNKKMLSKHATFHDSKRIGYKTHQCSFCQKNFKKHSDLVRHIRTHTGEKPFACDKCEKKFSLKSTLLSHQRTHNPITHKQFSCVVCNSFFTSKSSLKVHMTVHTGDKMYKCTFCSSRFRTAAHRKSHETSYHLNPSKKRSKNRVTNLLESVAMDVLNQQDQSGLQNGQSIGEGESENVLVVQEQVPLSGDPLHLLTEPSQNPVESGQLDPLILQQLQSHFLLQDNLITSSLIQLDDGTILNVKTFNSEQQLQEAATTVEKPRNLECDICHKKYASKDVLRKHRKIHGIDKKFRCTKCEKGFDAQEELDVHEKTHEGFRPYSCMYCTNSFSKEHSLNTHMKRLHKISVRDNLLLCDLKLGN